MAKIILARHGQSEWNLQDRFTGLADIGLTEKGYHDAVDGANALYARKIFPDVVFSSKLCRAYDTAVTMAHLLHYNPDHIIRHEGLNEKSYGDWEGQNKKIAKDLIGSDAVRFVTRTYRGKAPRGESHADIIEGRLSAFFNEMLEPVMRQDANILLAGHRNIFGSFLIKSGLTTAEEFRDIPIENGRPLLLDYNPDDLSISSDYEVLEL